MHTRHLRFPVKSPVSSSANIFLPSLPCRLHTNNGHQSNGGLANRGSGACDEALKGHAHASPDSARGVISIHRHKLPCQVCQRRQPAAARCSPTEAASFQDCLTWQCGFHPQSTLKGPHELALLHLQVKSRIGYSFVAPDMVEMEEKLDGPPQAIWGHSNDAPGRPAPV